MPERLMTRKETKARLEFWTRPHHVVVVDEGRYIEALRTALALHVRVAAFEECAEKYLVNHEWRENVMGERFCPCCAGIEAHVPNCFVGRLVELVEGSDADEEGA